MRLFKNQTQKNWIQLATKRISSSGVMLEDSDGKLLVVKATYKPYWTVPGGLVDDRETPKQAAVREVFEEIGVRINERDMVFILVADRMSSQLQTYQFLFKAKLSNDMKAHIILQDSEIEDCALVSKAQVELGDRNYAKAVMQWASNVTGYVEQVFDK